MALIRQGVCWEQQDPCFTKLSFQSQKHVPYGDGVYVSGKIPELGEWRPAQALRLKWNQGDFWTGFLLLLLPANQELIQFKYFVGRWFQPELAPIEWEVGAHNRVCQIGPHVKQVYMNDMFNMDRILLKLHAPMNILQAESQYYVIGDLRELGEWREKKPLLPEKGSIGEDKQNIENERTISGIFSLSFLVYRAKEYFHYYYLKKNRTFRSEPKPGRVYYFANPHMKQPNRAMVTRTNGEIIIQDLANIDELIYSSITDRIYVGSYLKCARDVQKLKDEGITGVLSIQSERDFYSHQLSLNSMHSLCEQYGMVHLNYEIEDMNNKDFARKGLGAATELQKLLKKNYRVYVHCTAGIYRSPQVIALYLSMYKNYSPEEAAGLLQKKHPRAKPNLQLIVMVLKQADLNRT